MCGIWGSGLAFQVQFKREDSMIRGSKVPWDWSVGVSVGPILLLFGCEYLSDTD